MKSRQIELAYCPHRVPGMPTERCHLEPNGLVALEVGESEAIVSVQADEKQVLQIPIRCVRPLTVFLRHQTAQNLPKGHDRNVRNGEIHHEYAPWLRVGERPELMNEAVFESIADVLGEIKV